MSLFGTATTLAPAKTGKAAKAEKKQPAACPTPTGCREHGCHGECLPPNDKLKCPPPAQ